MVSIGTGRAYITDCKKYVVAQVEAGITRGPALAVDTWIVKQPYINAIWAKQEYIEVRRVGVCYVYAQHLYEGYRSRIIDSDRGNDSVIINDGLGHVCAVVRVGCTPGRNGMRGGRRSGRRA